MKKINLELRRGVVDAEPAHSICIVVEDVVASQRMASLTSKLSGSISGVLQITAPDGKNTFVQLDGFERVDVWMSDAT